MAVRSKDLVELLLAKGARVNAKKRDGITPLDIAKQQGRIDVAEVLKNHGAIH